MQRKVIGILRKYLDVAYGEERAFWVENTELTYVPPFAVLYEGDASEDLAEHYTVVEPRPEDAVLRPLARELIAAIRGVGVADLIAIPSKARMIRILRDFVPYGTFDSEEREIDWAEYHADALVTELRKVMPSAWWRGKRIGGGDEGYD